MGNFEITDNFYLDGKPFQIISGAIHYFRIVPEYWQDRGICSLSAGADEEIDFG